LTLIFKDQLLAACNGRMSSMQLLNTLFHTGDMDMHYLGWKVKSTAQKLLTFKCYLEKPGDI